MLIQAECREISVQRLIFLRARTRYGSLRQADKSTPRSSPCVKCAFSVADQKFAADLLACQVSVEQIERAILLGCLRKHVSWLNGSDSGPIVSLAYFRDLIEEAGEPEMPTEHWAFQKLMQLKYEDL